MRVTGTHCGRLRWPRAIAFLLAGLAFGAGAAPAPQPAEIMPLAVRSLVLDITEGDSRAIAVGERGHVLVSESRSDWRQAEGVPVRSTLTAVTSVGDLVWAVGHDGTIIHSGDGGLSWSLQRFDPWVAPAEDAAWEDFDPQQGAPLLDVLFFDQDNGLAIGAYSLMLRTADGGQTWERVDLLAQTTTAPAGDPAGDAAQAAEGAADEEESWTFDADDLALMEESDPHLNAITRTGSGGLLIVAERGATFRSRDGGLTWQRQQMPYAGSMFGVVGYEADHVLAFGLRGNVLESRDLGDSWQLVNTGTTLSLMGGAGLPQGGAVLVGANGIVLHRPDAEAPFAASTYQTPRLETPVLACVLPRGTSTFVVCGESGIGQLQLN